MKDAAHWDKLNAKQRAVIAARCAVLDHLNKHAAHVGKANAIGEFVQNARQGVLSPNLQHVLQIAHGKAGSAVPSIAPRTLYNWLKAHQIHGPIGLCPGFGTKSWQAQEYAYFRRELNKVSAQIINHYGAPSFMSWIYGHGDNSIWTGRITLLLALRHFAQSMTQEQAIATLLRFQDENAFDPLWQAAVHRACTPVRKNIAPKLTRTKLHNWLRKYQYDMPETAP